MIVTKHTIRERNEAIVLSTIIDNHEISRTDISKITKLNKASVSSIVQKLLDEKLIYEHKLGKSTELGGRRPTFLVLNNKSSLSISIDIGVNYIDGMIGYIDGTILSKILIKNTTINSNNIRYLLLDLIDNLVKNQTDTPHGIVGIAISVHGIVFNNEILFTPYYDIDKVNIKKIISECYNGPIYIENEANLSALGEYIYSDESNNLISISVDSGVGAGIIENGNIYHGNIGRAGEIGHMILFPQGKNCPCGNSGCLEQYISNTILYKNIEEQIKINDISPEIIKQLYNSKNPNTIEIINQYTQFLSIGINNIIMIYNPETILINNSITREIPSLIDDIKYNLKNNFSKKVILKNNNLGDNAILLGGIGRTFQNFFNISNLKISRNRITR